MTEGNTNENADGGEELCFDYGKITAIEDEIRDMINWLAVFKEEYKLPDEVVKILEEKLRDLAQKVAGAKK